MAKKKSKKGKSTSVSVSVEVSVDAENDEDKKKADEVVPNQPDAGNVSDDGPQTRGHMLRSLAIFLYLIFIACALPLLYTPDPIEQVTSGGKTRMAILVFSTIGTLFALAIAYAKRAKSEDTPYRSHYHWMIRSFWIGGAVYLPVLTVIGVIVMYMQLPVGEIMAQIYEGNLDTSDPVAMQQLSTRLLSEHGPTINRITLISMAPFIVWWVLRQLRGMMLAIKGQPVTRENTWLL